MLLIRKWQQRRHEERNRKSWDYCTEITISVCYVTNAGPALSNKCLISPVVHSHVSLGQGTIKDVSGMSMKTGRAIVFQFLTNVESEKNSYTMSSHWSPNSSQFASAKPVIDTCQRKRVVLVSSKATGKWRELGGHAEVVKEDACEASSWAIQHCVLCMYSYFNGFGPLWYNSIHAFKFIVGGVVFRLQFSFYVMILVMTVFLYIFLSPQANEFITV